MTIKPSQKYPLAAKNIRIAPFQEDTSSVVAETQNYVSLRSNAPQSLPGNAVINSTALSAALLTACGGGSSNSTNAAAEPKPVQGVAPSTDAPPPGTAPATPPAVSPVSSVGFNNFPVATDDAAAARFLLQSQFSAADGELAVLRATSFANYLQTQFAKPIGQLGWDWLESRGYSTADKYGYVYTAWPADYMIWCQLFTAPDAMRKRCALALSEFFVVSMQSTTASFLWRGHAFAHYWDILCEGAFTNFRTLLENITLSPAMGHFLNMKGSQKEDATGRQPDENYAREIMQLFTIGLNKLNLDGTEQLDGSGKPIATFNLVDVTNLARVFTGYDLDNSQGKNSVDIIDANDRITGNKVDSKESVRRAMVFDNSKHSQLEVNFLGSRIAAGVSGETALQSALDTLFNHPNVGPFFAKQMIQRFVTSHPSPAYVARVASVFNNNGAAVRGDLKAVWTAILLDDDARSPMGLTSPSFGKLREPMLRFIQWGRSFGIRSTQGSWKVFDTSDPERLGQAPLRAPSVFNFFRPGYIPPNTALADNKAPAPEFQQVNEISVCNYLNFMTIVINWQGLPVYDADKRFIDKAVETFDIAVDYGREVAIAADAAKLIDRLNILFCAGQMSVSSKALILQALDATPLTSQSSIDQRLDRVKAAIFMVMASHEYLVQK